ncbi:endodeoxyribonuclease [Tulasnella sp. 419]|nr:endodeoxyribonuclease [Tulasnella sp. 419]
MNCIEDVQNRLSEGLSDLCDNEMLCWEDAICFEDDQKDALIVDLAATFGLSRSALNVRASSKGLFVGCSMVLHLSSGQSISGSDIEPSLIPHSSDITRVEMQNDLAWVLVVEKEAVFRTLCRMGLASHPSLFGPGIIITGKGYPDFATRELLHTLSAELPQRYILHFGSLFIPSLVLSGFRS